MITTIKFNNLFLISASTIAGPKEKEGPLSEYFDISYQDLMAGESSYEKGEAKMIKQAIKLALQKAKLNDVDLIVGGDLTNQIASSNEALKDFMVSFLGVYGACSTSMLSLIIASCFVNSSMCKNALSFASSNYGSAERQFRYPLEYGVKKKQTATTTVTGAGAVVISTKNSKIQIISATIGRVINADWDNVNDMGSAMSYAAFDTIINHLKNTHTTPEFYDLILTGDLSEVGSNILKDLFLQEGIELKNYQDAGNVIFDNKKQKDVYCGGSGCACLALTSYGYIFDQMVKKKLKDVLLIGTGCLHSKISTSQKEKIPVIAHLVHLRRV